MPASSPVITQTARVKTSTGTLSVISVSDGSVKAGISATMASMMFDASSAPSAPPASETTRLSARSCRTIAPRVAPMDVRIASSRWRVVPRASRRLATFAHAISSRKPHRPEQQPQASLGVVADEVVPEGLDADRPGLARDGSLALERGRERRHACVGFSEPDAILEPSHHVQPATGAELVFS